MYSINMENAVKYLSNIWSPLIFFTKRIYDIHIKKVKNSVFVLKYHINKIMCLCKIQLICATILWGNYKIIPCCGTVPT